MASGCSTQTASSAIVVRAIVASVRSGWSCAARRVGPTSVGVGCGCDCECPSAIGDRSGDQTADHGVGTRASVIAHVRAIEQGCTVVDDVADCCCRHRWRHCRCCCRRRSARRMRMMPAPRVSSYRGTRLAAVHYASARRFVRCLPSSPPVRASIPAPRRPSRRGRRRTSRRRHSTRDTRRRGE